MEAPFEVVFLAILIGYFLLLVYADLSKKEDVFAWKMLTEKEASCLLALYRGLDLYVDLPLFEELRKTGLCYSPYSQDKVSLTFIGNRVVEKYLKGMGRPLNDNAGK
jgi:hypothetical protein